MCTFECRVGWCVWLAVCTRMDWWAGVIMTSTLSTSLLDSMQSGGWFIQILMSQTFTVKFLLKCVQLHRVNYSSKISAMDLTIYFTFCTHMKFQCHALQDQSGKLGNGALNRLHTERIGRRYKLPGEGLSGQGQILLWDAFKDSFNLL